MQISTIKTYAAVLGRATAMTAALGTILITQSASAIAGVVTYTNFSDFVAAAATLTTETFEGGPWVPAGNKAQGTSNLGVTWTSADQLASTVNTSHSPRTGITSVDPLVNDTYDWIAVLLPGNVTAVGAWITSYNMPHNTELRAYDSLNNLLGSVILGNTGRDFSFFGLTTDTAIARVVFISTNVINPIGDDFALDDFAFGIDGGPIQVPEPSTLALFGAALAGIAFGKRRKMLA